MNEEFWEKLKEKTLENIPILIGISLVYIASFISQGSSELSKESISLLAIALVFFVIIYISRGYIFKKHQWLYFVIQGIVVFNCVFIVPKGYKAIFLGLIPILISQSFMMYREKYKVFLSTGYYFSIFGGTIIIHDGFQELKEYFLMLLLITSVVLVYYHLYAKQVASKIQMQNILWELESAYDKLEDLTRIKERQRMAQDMHDTLSQGLVALVMNLDAIDANLKKQKIERAQEIVNQTIAQARSTLLETRSSIHDLRINDFQNNNLSETIHKEIEKFKENTNIYVEEQINVSSPISNNQFKQIVYIVREALNNILKHAKATKVIIKIIEEEDIFIFIEDNGIGFKIDKIEERFGHYGIIGMKERVKSLNGTIYIKSMKKKGVAINIRLPIIKE